MTIQSLAAYLGRPISELLSAVPFKFWKFEESYDDCLEEPRFDFVFEEDGMEITCSADKRVRTIFLHAGAFDECLVGLSFSLTRRQIAERFGRPTKSGAKRIDPILGEYGAWDRFDGPDYALHIQYRFDAGSIKLVTLMRTDVAP
ncbi:MAG: hypothetical protein U1E49_15635 [Hyphomicrobiaceae bacterium]